MTIFTSHHDPKHCFEETRDGTLKVLVRGSWLPQPRRSFSLLFAIARSFFLAWTLVYQWALGFLEVDCFFVDQLSISIPVLRLTGAKVDTVGRPGRGSRDPWQIFFYGHYPDRLLTERGSLLKQLYRKPLDFMEEVTTSKSLRFRAASHASL